VADVNAECDPEPTHLKYLRSGARSPERDIHN
jgi:hypothetical protein